MSDEAFYQLFSFPFLSRNDARITDSFSWPTTIYVQAGLIPLCGSVVISPELTWKEIHFGVVSSEEIQ